MSLTVMASWLVFVQKFQEELRVQQANIDKVRYMAEDILQSCHPNAVRNVKYYLTITQTRWEQVISSCTLVAVTRLL